MLYDFFAQHLNYYLLFLWSLLEGEIGLTLAGSLCKEELLQYSYVLSIAVTAAFLGDLLLFTLGRRYGVHLKNYLINHQAEVTMIQKYFLKYGSWFIFFERYLYGAHIPTLLLIGSTKYSYVKFIIIDLIAVSVWAMIFVSLGFYFDREVIGIFHLISKYLTLFMILIASIIMLKVIRRD